jgi:hypothetical protein
MESDHGIGDHIRDGGKDLLAFLGSGFRRRITVTASPFPLSVLLDRQGRKNAPARNSARVRTVSLFGSCENGPKSRAQSSHVDLPKTIETDRALISCRQQGSLSGYCLQGLREGTQGRVDVRIRMCEGEIHLAAGNHKDSTPDQLIT